MSNDKDAQGSLEAAEPAGWSAKEIKEVADAASATVDVVKKTAAFVDGLFGNAISNSMGLISDKLAYYRLEKAIDLQERVEKKLAARGVQRRYVPVSFGLPIIEKATVEDDPTLQDKWANLLSNARDATYHKPLRRNYTTILGDMEPVDAKLLDRIVSEYLGLPTKDRSTTLFVKDKLIAAHKMSAEDCENSIRNLMRLGLLKPGTVQGGMSFGDHAVSAYKDTEMFGVTLMGVDFYYAVNETKK